MADQTKAERLTRYAELTRQISFLKGQLDALDAERKEITRSLAEEMQGDPTMLVVEGVGVARPSVKRGSRSIDAISFASKPGNESYVVELVRRGGVTIPIGALKKGRSAADDEALRYLMPGSETPTVEIELL